MKSVRASSVDHEEPDWRWDHYFLKGTLSTVVGVQSYGKSTFLSYIVARLSQGQSLPGQPARHPVACGWMAIEETQSVVVDRLKAAGADLDNVDIIEGTVEEDKETVNGEVVGTEETMFTLPRGIEALRQMIEDEGIEFLVMDGLGYLPEGDSGYISVGKALLALRTMAEKTGCTVVGTCHVAKGGNDPLSIAIGTTAWSSVPRTVSIITWDPDDMEETDVDARRRGLRLVKTNFKNLSYGETFRLTVDDETGSAFVDPDSFDHGHYSREVFNSTTHQPHGTWWSTETHRWEKVKGDGEKGPGIREQNEIEAFGIVRAIFERHDGEIGGADLFKEAHEAGVGRTLTTRARNKIAIMGHERREDGTLGPVLWRLIDYTAPSELAKRLEALLENGEFTVNEAAELRRSVAWAEDTIDGLNTGRIPLPGGYRTNDVL